MSSGIRLLDPIGAELVGVDLRDLADGGFAELRAALLAHGVVLLRDQQLAPQQQVDLGRRFGEIEGQEFTEHSPHRDMIVISNVGPQGQVMPRSSEMMRMIEINETWHTDSSFREIPASVSIFHAIEVPPVGGDTFYASLRRGWLELDPTEREALEGRRALHDYGQAYRRTGGGVPAAYASALPPVPHPMVRAHPETGERCLYVSGHAYGVEGMSPAQGRAWIEKLVAWCTRDGRVYRHRWQKGDVVLWDNRCMLHRAEGFPESHRRVMHHVRVAGAEP